jgi:TonB family protein
LVYPKSALTNGIEAKVEVRTLVDRGGYCVRAFVEGMWDCRNSPECDLLAKSALQTVQATRLTPAIVNGQPTPVWVMIHVVFRVK